MKNPWLKKNPLMSLWLSGAHKVASAARGQAAAAIKREAIRASKDAVAEGSRQVLDFWGGAPGGATQPKAKARKRLWARAPGRWISCQRHSLGV